MEYFIWNPTLGYLRKNGKWSEGVVLGSSSFCAMSFSNARMARLFIEEEKRVNLDFVVSREQVDAYMIEQAKGTLLTLSDCH